MGNSLSDLGHEEPRQHGPIYVSYSGIPNSPNTLEYSAKLCGPHEDVLVDGDDMILMQTRR